MVLYCIGMLAPNVCQLSDYRLFLHEVRMKYDIIIIIIYPYYYYFQVLQPGEECLQHLKNLRLSCTVSPVILL